jgi:hypothetical protein
LSTIEDLDRANAKAKFKEFDNILMIPAKFSVEIPKSSSSKNNDDVRNIKNFNFRLLRIYQKES